MQNRTGKPSWFERDFRQAEHWCSGPRVEPAELSHLAKPKRFSRAPALRWRRGRAHRTGLVSDGVPAHWSPNTDGLGPAGVGGRGGTIVLVGRPASPFCHAGLCSLFLRPCRRHRVGSEPAWLCARDDGYLMGLLTEGRRLLHSLPPSSASRKLLMPLTE